MNKNEIESAELAVALKAQLAEGTINPNDKRSVNFANSLISQAASKPSLSVDQLQKGQAMLTEMRAKSPQVKTLETCATCKSLPITQRHKDICIDGEDYYDYETIDADGDITRHLI